MRASKHRDGDATHVLSASCAVLQSSLGNEASRGKGMEIPDALKLLDRLDLKGKIVTGRAQSNIAGVSAEGIAIWILIRRALRACPLRPGRRRQRDISAAGAPVRSAR